ncbi:UNVERIFIED_CONTAM: hypothetical protein PYX00_008786 [Menopon gallinae]|uniref:DUS-like FMN-binding domain-containing protein n=1 Tax=Menopon gallinae TaxID=328185 RepID=A0AAW2HPH8_9NEOP
MIMADSFVKSEKARKNEFTTNDKDAPLIVQFAASNVKEFVEATQLVSPYSDGVDLNCGCPQRKIESAGATFLTVHGRTQKQKTEPVDINSLKEIACSIQIPLILNGDVKSLDDALLMHEITKCQGVMSARGILHNPALFKGYKYTPVQCIEDWVQIALDSNLQFRTFHHHLIFMLGKVLPKVHRRKVNAMVNYPDVIYFLNQYYDFDFKLNKFPNITSTFSDIHSSPGKYFTEVA